jgi:myosin heavy subunit
VKAFTNKHRDAINETERLRVHLKEIAESRRGEYDDRSKEIEELKSTILQYELDVEAMNSLGNDYNELQQQSQIQQQEITRLQTALHNLELVLEQLQTEKDRNSETYEKELKSLRSTATQGQSAIQQLNSMQQQFDDMQNSMKQSRDQLAASQKYVMKLESENHTLRRGLSETMERFKRFNTDENVIDRRLVVKMLTTYFERQQNQEVLDVMMRVLQFTDEDKGKINAARGFTGLTGGIRKFVSFLSPFDSQDKSAADSWIPTENASDANLADLWVDFLLSQTAAVAEERHRAASGMQNAQPVHSAPASRIVSESSSTALQQPATPSKAPSASSTSAKAPSHANT